MDEIVKTAKVYICEWCHKESGEKGKIRKCEARHKRLKKEASCKHLNFSYNCMGWGNCIEVRRKCPDCDLVESKDIQLDKLLSDISAEKLWNRKESTEIEQFLNG